MRKNSLNTWGVLLLLAVATNAPAAEKNTAYQAAIDSIAAEEMFQTVDVLAGPKFEGREAGSTGGHAAGDYLVEQLRKLPLTPAGEKQGYFQPFGNNYRNILALLPGSDPLLKDQTIVVGAHYDHLGHGNPRNNNPPGTIYPGADDNASGSSGVIELARAFSSLPVAPRRSILFILFDGEEKGLLGSKHWTADPTLPLNRVKFMLNLDMIGALRADRVLVFGTRTALGLRRMASMSNQDGGLTLDFSWVMRGDADHYSFYDRGIPAIFLHTDLHERYHKPTDVAAKINRDGMMRVARLAFAMLYQWAEAPVLPRFRPAAKAENEDVAPSPGSGRADRPAGWRSAHAAGHCLAERRRRARCGDRQPRCRRFGRGGRPAYGSATASIAWVAAIFPTTRPLPNSHAPCPGRWSCSSSVTGGCARVVLQFPLEGGKSKKTA